MQKHSRGQDFCRTYGQIDMGRHCFKKNVFTEGQKTNILMRTQNLGDMAPTSYMEWDSSLNINNMESLISSNTGWDSLCSHYTNISKMLLKDLDKEFIRKYFLNIKWKQIHISPNSCSGGESSPKVFIHQYVWFAFEYIHFWPPCMKLIFILFSFVICFVCVCNANFDENSHLFQMWFHRWFYT